MSPKLKVDCIFRLFTKSQRARPGCTVDFKFKYSGRNCDGLKVLSWTEGVQEQLSTNCAAYAHSLRLPHQQSGECIFCILKSCSHILHIAAYYIAYFAYCRQLTTKTSKPAYWCIFICIFICIFCILNCIAYYAYCAYNITYFAY